MSTWKRDDDRLEVGVGRVFEGSLDASTLELGIVVARFNDHVTGELLLGAVEEVKARGVAEQNIDVAWVPGAFELPIVAKKMAQSGRYQAIVCLGAVIRGETPHFDLVAGEAAAGVAQAGLETGVPILFGVLTTETLDQAERRSHRARANKGAETAAAAIEMANLLAALDD
jgi:6,7-dimethyl-8-ribityllumazine synthase